MCTFSNSGRSVHKWQAKVVPILGGFVVHGNSDDGEWRAWVQAKLLAAGMSSAGEAWGAGKVGSALWRAPGIPTPEHSISMIVLFEVMEFGVDLR